MGTTRRLPQPLSDGVPGIPLADCLCRSRWSADDRLFWTAPARLASKRDASEYGEATTSRCAQPDVEDVG